MTTEPPNDDIKTVWLNQETEALAMSTAQLRAGAQTFQSKIQRRNLIEYAAAVLVVFGSAFWMWKIPNLYERIGQGLLILGTLVVVYELHRRGSAKRVPPDASASSYLDFHRAEMVRQRDALSSVWLWYLAPFAPGMLVLTVSHALYRYHGQWLAFVIGAAPVVIIFTGCWLLNRHVANKLQRHIDALDTMSGE